MSDNPTRVEFSRTLSAPNGEVLITIVNGVNADITTIQTLLMAVQTKLPGLFPP